MRMRTGLFHALDHFCGTKSVYNRLPLFRWAWILARMGIHSVWRGFTGQRKVELDVRNPTRLWNEAVLLTYNSLNLSIRCHDRLPVYRMYLNPLPMTSLRAPRFS